MQLHNVRSNNPSQSSAKTQTKKLMVHINTSKNRLIKMLKFNENWRNVLEYCRVAHAAVLVINLTDSLMRVIIQ